MIKIIDTDDMEKGWEESKCKICNGELNIRSYKEKDINNVWTRNWICRHCHDMLKTYGTTDRSIINKKKHDYYGKICPICNKEKLLPHIACRERDKTGKKTGLWICQSCYNKSPWHINYYNNWQKSKAGIRTGEVDINCTTIKGNLGEELTSRVFDVDNLNKKNDNYSRGTPVDHSSHPTLGILQTRIRYYDSYNQLWSEGGLERDWNKNFDNMLIWCASRNGDVIEAGYIIPKGEITKRKSIGIIKNYKYGWYEKYRIKDPEIFSKVNEIWSKILEERNAICMG